MALLNHTAGSFPVDSEAANHTATSLPARKPPVRSTHADPLLTAEEVADRLHVSTDWVWDHSSRKKPYLPVIRMGDGALRYRNSAIEAFIDERERLSSLSRRIG